MEKNHFLCGGTRPTRPTAEHCHRVVERSPKHRMPAMTVLFESSTSWREPHIAEQLSAMRMRWDGRESVNVSAYVTVSGRIGDRVGDRVSGETALWGGGVPSARARYREITM